MIKVNLLRDQTVRSRVTVAVPVVSPIKLWALTALAAVAVVIGASWYFLHMQVGDLTRTRDRLKLEFARMQDLSKQIEQFQQLTQERQNRIDIIEQLQANQTGPVLLLNHIIHSIPTTAAVWLTSVEQKGDQVRIMGCTVRGEAIPDFMSTLAATGFFKTVDLELYEDTDKDPAKFTLICVSTRKTPTE